MPATEFRDRLYQALRECRLEEALAALQRNPERLPAHRVDSLVERLEGQARQLQMAGEIGACRRMERHIFALRALLAHGPQACRVIRDVELTPNYDGKILLMKLAGGLLDGKLCLRGGDEWHREILRNTVAEIGDLGFTAVQVLPLGGGLLRFEDQRHPRLRGASDEFGRCDMELAAKLLSSTFPETNIRVDD